MVITWWRGRPTMDGKTALGASSPANPALHMPEPLSTTRAATSSSHILIGIWRVWLGLGLISYCEVCNVCSPYLSILKSPECVSLFGLVATQQKWKQLCFLMTGHADFLIWAQKQCCSFCCKWDLELHFWRKNSIINAWFQIMQFLCDFW